MLSPLLSFHCEGESWALSSSLPDPSFRGGWTTWARCRISYFSFRTLNVTIPAVILPRSQTSVSCSARRTLLVGTFVQGSLAVPKPHAAPPTQRANGGPPGILSMQCTTWYCENWLDFEYLSHSIRIRNRNARLVVNDFIKNKILEFLSSPANWSDFS